MGNCVLDRVLQKTRLDASLPISQQSSTVTKIMPYQVTIVCQGRVRHVTLYMQKRAIHFANLSATS